MTEPRPILVIGGAGLLGEALTCELASRGGAFVAPHESDLDLAATDLLEEGVEAIRPRAVINAAAYTDVTRAELPAERELVFRVNRDGPAALARACRRLGLPLIHISTDYVFDGRKGRPYREGDPVHPLQVYGRSKLAGEAAIRGILDTALIVRTSTLFGPGCRERPHYVDAVLRQARERGPLRVVRAPVSSPTYAPDLACALLLLLERGATGLVHVVNPGQCSRLELAREAVRLAGLSSRVEVLERPEPASGLDRPAYSVLDTSRYAALTGGPLRPWTEALREYLKAR
jgi:dTDP-4-dehydrorhamnose reductase